MENRKPQSLPEIVDQAVSAHFEEHLDAIKDGIGTRVEDVQMAMLDELLTKIKARYIDRTVSLEARLSENRYTLEQIQQHSARADHDLHRLAAGLERFNDKA